MTGGIVKNESSGLADHGRFIELPHSQFCGFLESLKNSLTHLLLIEVPMSE